MAEVRVLEYWRKKYLRQVVLVGVLAGGVAGAGVFFSESFLVKLLALLLAAVFFYVMFKAIREDLQARFEGALLMSAGRQFAELKFDIGRGGGEEALNAQEVCPAYGGYECFNVIKGAGFSFEEVLLSDDARFSLFSVPVFEGVILRISLKDNVATGKGAARLFNGKLVFEGEAAAFLGDAREEVLTLFKLFAVKQAMVSFYQGAVYFWLNGAKKIYVQAGLFSYNPPVLFFERIRTLCQTGEALRDRFCVRKK